MPVRITMNSFYARPRGKHLANPVPPEPYRLVADIDAALAKNILDLAQRPRIPDAHHHGEANNLGRRVKNRYGFLIRRG